MGCVEAMHIKRGHREQVERAIDNVRLQARRVLRLACEIPHREDDLPRSAHLPEHEGVDVELDRAVVDGRRARRARAQPTLQRRLACLAVSEQHETRAIGGRLARGGELDKVASDGRDALACDGRGRALERVVLELEFLDVHEVADGGVERGELVVRGIEDLERHELRDGRGQEGEVVRLEIELLEALQLPDRDGELRQLVVVQREHLEPLGEAKVLW